VPLIEWLDRTEKQVKDMELVPTDEEKIQQRIKEHNVSVNSNYRAWYCIVFISNSNRSLYR
jgi:hypothetical protein